jgi:hypothetical protein
MRVSVRKERGKMHRNVKRIAVILAAASGIAGGVAVTTSVTASAGVTPAAAAPCGHSLQRTHGNVYDVIYRHCTSGSDSVRVRAIINNAVDGSCQLVRAGQTKAIHSFETPVPNFPDPKFDRIERC